MVFRYSRWDGTQSIDPLDADDLLDQISRDMLEDGDLRRALERLLMRGANGRDGQRRQGMRDLLERLRQRREDQLNRHDLSGFMDDINERLSDIIDQERSGIDRMRQQAQDPDADDAMRRMAEQMAQRKGEAMDQMPEDAAGRLKQLMDYEFVDQKAREDFQELVDELRQKMLGEQFKMMQQGLERMTQEDMAPIKEMVRDLNELLAKHARGGATDRDFREFMAKHGHMFPDNINSIDDLVEYLEQSASQMASLLASMPAEMRQQLMETMQALMQDEQLQMELMQMGDLIEQITGRPLGRRYPFQGDDPVGFDEALRRSTSCTTCITSMSWSASYARRCATSTSTMSTRT
jgi:uncharacterized protein with von Willebrand factor type A (vWA) domain